MVKKVNPEESAHPFFFNKNDKHYRIMNSGRIELMTPGCEPN